MWKGWLCMLALLQRLLPQPGLNAWRPWPCCGGGSAWGHCLHAWLGAAPLLGGVKAAMVCYWDNCWTEQTFGEFMCNPSRIRARDKVASSSAVAGCWIWSVKAVGAVNMFTSALSCCYSHLGRGSIFPVPAFSTLGTLTGSPHHPLSCIAAQGRVIQRVCLSKLLHSDKHCQQPCKGCGEIRRCACCNDL